MSTADSIPKAEPQLPTPSNTNLAEITEWNTAEKETREAAKWFILALGGVAAAIFGGAPIVVRNTYVLATDWPAVLIEAVSALAALIAVTVMIREISKIMVPVKITLDYIDNRPKLQEKFDSSPSLWFPTSISTFQELCADMYALREGAALLSAELASNTARIAQLNCTNPTVEEASKLTSLESAASTQATYLTSFERSYIIDRSYAARIVAEVSLLNLQSRFLENTKLKYAALVTVSATVIFVLALSVKPAPDSNDPPRVGSLARVTSPAAISLWRQLNLAPCESNGAVPVVIIEVDATASSVQTVPWNPDCAPKQFTVTEALGIITVQEPLNIVTVTSEPPQPSTVAPST